MPDAPSHQPNRASPLPPAPVLFRIGPLSVTRRRALHTLLALSLLAAAATLWGRLDPADLHARARALPASVVVAAIAILPLAGFPVTGLHLIAGVRFDFLGGMAVVAVTSVLHHLLGWALVRLLPARVFQGLHPWRQQLLGAGHRDTTLLCCLMPGMPYTAQLYLLPILGTPFHLMVVLSSLLHTARAVVTILLGDFSDQLTPGRLASLAVYYILLWILSALALGRLRRTLAPARPSQA